MGADTGKTKLEAAQKHGVTVIDEVELEKLLRERLGDDHRSVLRQRSVSSELPVN